MSYYEEIKEWSRKRRIKIFYGKSENDWKSRKKILDIWRMKMSTRIKKKTTKNTSHIIQKNELRSSAINKDGQH